MNIMTDTDWYYVNLASRPDRNEHAKAEFAKQGIEARRFEGFTPDQWPGKSSKVDRMMKRTPGAVGCYQSQMHLIRLAQNSNRIIGVCEDDVCFCDDLMKRLLYIQEHLTWDWDIFYLGATFHVPGEWYKRPGCESWHNLARDVSETDAPHILRTYGIWSTYAYLVNPKNAEKTYTLFDENIYRADGIDHLAIILGPQLNTFCFVPGCAWQYDGESNIGDGVTRFSGFQKLGPYVWTDRMEDFDPATFNWSPK